MCVFWTSEDQTSKNRDFQTLSKNLRFNNTLQKYTNNFFMNDL